MALYAFDGTWNFRDEKDAVLGVEASQYGEDPSFRRDTLETNVHRFREFLGPQHSEYVEGPGTRLGGVGRLFGGAFGMGGKWRIRRMYRRLAERYHGHGAQPIDRVIDIVGFSRGAALAVHFANLINERGIPDPRGRRHLAWSYHRLLGWSWRLPKAVRGGDAPAIRFLGLWDTVASIGIPIRPFRNRPTKRWQVTTIPANVARSFHAMALDEVRATFALVRPQHVRPERHYELWFRGVHSNVGGGYPDRGLSDISLAWMMEMYAWTMDKEHPPESDIAIPVTFAQAFKRLQPDPSDESSAWTGTTMETLLPNADGELGRPAAVSHQAWRAMPPKPLVHHSAFRRTPNLLLDHYSANRRLLRPLPGDAEPVYDPPFFYGLTPRQEAHGIANDAFYHVPVRASDWLTLDGLPVVRSDDWLGAGRRRQEVTDATRQSTFVLVATEWLLNGRCTVEALTLPATFKDYDGREIDARVTARWVIRVLNALEPFVPRLRAFRAAAATPSSATSAAPVVSADGTVTTGPPAPAAGPGT